MELPEIIERPLPPSRERPARFYSLYPSGGYLAHYVVELREWFRSDDANEPPALSLYAVQGDRLDGFLLLRLNPLPLAFPLYDDTEADEGRVFRCTLFPAACDCKGWRTFRRCSHLDIFRDAVTQHPAQNSEPDNCTTDEIDRELESWVLGEVTP